MKRLEYTEKMEKYKDTLPVGIVPMIMKKYPHLNRNRVANALKCITLDEDILDKVRRLSEYFNE